MSLSDFERYLSNGIIRHNLSAGLVRKGIDHVSMRPLVRLVVPNMATQSSHPRHLAIILTSYTPLFKFWSMPVTKNNH